MGEIADKMTSGELCSQCGVHLAPGDTVYLPTGEKVYMPNNGEPFGVPVLCEFCNDDEQPVEDKLFESLEEGQKLYGLLMKSDKKLFLELSQEGALATYDSIETVKEQFEEVRNKASFFLEEIRPLVIQYPKNAIDIKDYLEDENTYDVVVGNKYVGITFKGGMANERMKELVVYDVYNQLPGQD